MPGIRVAYTLHAPPAHAAPGSPAKGGDATDSAFSDEYVQITAVHPDGYPLETLVTVESVTCMEGHVYTGDRASLLQCVYALGQQPSSGDDVLAAAVRSCAEAVDGDFVIVFYDRGSKRLCIFCDRLGRLPVYYHLAGDKALISREQPYVRERLRAASVDAMALAQLLLFGYPLGSRTLVAGVQRLLPGEVLIADSTGARVVRPERSPFTVDTPRRNARECVPDICEAFVSACRDRRIDENQNVLSLSGGMDSRTVGAGMRSALGPFSSVTFSAPGSPHPDERDCAEEVARVLGADWRPYEFDYADEDGIREIVRIKLGLSPVDLAFGLPYVRRVRADFPGAVSFWTGEGGDKLFCDHRAIPREPDADALARFIIAKNAIWHPGEVAALTGVHPDDLVSGVHVVATRSANGDREDAYLRFLLSQRVVRWHFEGEDRHRTSVWPIAPFYAREVLSLARSVPTAEKIGRRFYCAFLKQLAPDVAAIPLPGGSAAPGSRRYALTHLLRDRLRYNRYALAAYRRLRARRRTSPRREVWLTHLESYLRGTSPPAPFRPDAVRRIASGDSPAPPNGLSLLLTAMAAADVIAAGRAAQTEPVKRR